MKNIFNGKRFMALLQNEALDLCSQYLKIILIGACVFLAISLLFIASGNDNHMIYERLRYVISYMFIFGSMLLAPFQLYKRYNHKTHGVNYFMLPASQTEKWLSMFFYCVIVMPVVAILAFALIDLCLYPFYPWAEKSLWSLYDTVASSDILTILAIQSIFFLGNIWFKRSKLQKTIMVIIILMVAYTALMSVLGKVAGSGEIIEMNQFSLSLSFGSLLDIIPQTWRVVIQAIIFLIAPIGLWILSFKKMQKQEL